MSRVSDEALAEFIKYDEENGWERTPDYKIKRDLRDARAEIARLTEENQKLFDLNRALIKQWESQQTEVMPERQFCSGDRVRWYHPPLCYGTVLKQAGPQVKVQWDTGEVRRDDPKMLVPLTAAAREKRQ